MKIAAKAREKREETAAKEGKPSAETTPHRLCVAPMMAWTDPHCRFLHRLLAPSARLYTEMVSVDALLRGNRERALAFSDAEHPLALQVGGHDREDLATAARLAAEAGFDEFNLNVGCPSPRVRKGAFGAALMQRPGHVAMCVRALCDAVDLPITVKCRIGVEDSVAAATAPADERDYGLLRDFVGQVAEAGARVFAVHARKAVLSGLTPAQNRAVPPLQPQLVERLKGDFPQIAIIYNGGIRDTSTARQHLRWADGVMIGRGAYQNPRWLGQLHAELFAQTPVDLSTALTAYLAYIDEQLDAGVPLHRMTRHLFGLFNGVAGARRFRQHLSNHDRGPNAGAQVLREALSFVRDGDDVGLVGNPELGRVDIMRWGW